MPGCFGDKKTHNKMKESYIRIKRRRCIYTFCAMTYSMYLCYHACDSLSVWFSVFLYPSAGWLADRLAGCLSLCTSKSVWRISIGRSVFPSGCQFVCLVCVIVYACWYIVNVCVCFSSSVDLWNRSMFCFFSYWR